MNRPSRLFFFLYRRPPSPSSGNPSLCTMKSTVIRLFIGLLILTGLAGCSVESKKARLLERAGAYVKAGEYDKAVIECQNVLQLDPNDLRAVEYLSQIWQDRGAPLRALPFLSKLRTAAPGNREVINRILKISLGLGKLAEVRREAAAILKKSPDDREALLSLAQASRSPEDFAELEKALKTADRGAAAYHVVTANLLLRRGDVNGAKSAFQRAVALEPKSPQAHTGLAGFYLRTNDRTQAGNELKTAAELAGVRSVERLQYAEFLAQTGAGADAKRYLEETTAKAPDYLPAWRALAYLATVEKKYDEAGALLAKVINRDPANYDARIAAAQLALAKGDLPRAITDLEQLGKQFPALAEDKFWLGRALLQQGQTAGAITALKAATVQNPDHDEATLLLGRLLLGTGDAESVVKSMATLLRDRPNLVAAQMLLIDAMVVLGRHEEAAAGIRAQIKATPDRVELHRLLGLVLNLMQKPAEARQSFERSLELTPGFLPIVAELLALDIREGKTAAARQRIQPELAKNPDAPVVRLLEARVLAAEKRWDEAEKVLVSLLDKEGDQAAVYDLLTQTFVMRKQTPGIAARLEELVAKRPQDPRPVMLAGSVYVQWQDFAKACATYEKFLAAKPDATIVLNNLAVLYAEKTNQLERGLELARKARKLDASSPEVADTLGWILFKRNEFVEALDLFKESAAKRPKNGEIQYHLGLTAQKLLQTEVARTAFQRAAQAGGDFPGKSDIPQRLQELGPAAPAPAGATKTK